MQTGRQQAEPEAHEDKCEKGGQPGQDSCQRGAQGEHEDHVGQAHGRQREDHDAFAAEPVSQPAPGWNEQRIDGRRQGQDTRDLNFGQASLAGEGGNDHEVDAHAGAHGHHGNADHRFLDPGERKQRPVRICHASGLPRQLL